MQRKRKHIHFGRQMINDFDLFHPLTIKVCSILDFIYMEYLYRKNSKITFTRPSSLNEYPYG